MPMPLKDRTASLTGSARANVSATPPSETMDMGQAMDTINAQLPAGASPLSEDDVFIFEMELSNSNIDAYYTRMTEDTLNNYADRINAHGVPLMEQHEDDIYPVGRMFQAAVTQDAAGVFRLPVMTYILRGDVNSAGISTDQIIKKIQGGVQRDVSIGFIAGGYSCSIDGLPMVPYWGGRAEGVQCEHFCGASYPDTNGIQQTCYAWVENGTILEGSLVYVGATPGALIQKAMNGAKQGKLTAKMANSVASALNINPALLTQETMKAGELLKKVANSGKVSDKMKRTLDEKAAEFAEENEDKAADVIGEQVEKVESENEELKTKNEELEKENNSLKPDAEAGKAYREEVLKATIAEGVRAYGADFKPEEMEKALRGMSFDMVKVMRSQYEMTTKALLRNSSTDNGYRIDPIPLDADGKPAESERIPVI